MFIIFGTARSGTTLLSAILDLHDQIVVPRETHLIVPLAFIVDRVRDPAVGKRMLKDLILNNRTFSESLGEYLTTEDVTEVIDTADYTVPALLQNLFARLACKAGKLHAGDKSPDDLYYLPILVSSKLLSGSIKIIHLVRDVRDVVLSLLKREWVSTELTIMFPRLWASHNLLLHDTLKCHPDYYLLVRYEDMVVHPREQFTRITSFLGVEFQEKMFDREARWRRYAHMPDHINLRQDFLHERVNVWKRELNPEDRKRIEDQAREALVRFGYELPE